MAGPVQKGVRVSSEEVERLKGLRALLDPSSSLKIVDDFAKYLFTASTVVATLGGAVKVTGLDGLHGTGGDLFSLALVALGVSLASAVFSLLPLGSKPNPNKIASLQGALGRILRFRLFWTTTAGVFFAAAIVLAGLAPLTSSKADDTPRGPAAITFALTENQAIEAMGWVDGAKPLTVASIRVVARKRGVLVRRGVRTDEEGRAVLKVTTGPTKTRRVTIRIDWTTPGNNERHRRKIIRLRASP